MDKIKLKRSLNLPLLAFYGVGTILGAGIYALIGKIAGISGQLAPLAFVVSAVVASLTAYSYCQLVKKFPHSAGEAEYVYQGFNSKSLSNIIGWLVVFTGIVSAATLTSGFIGYFQVFIDLPVNLIVFGLALFTVIIAIIGIKTSAWFALVITAIEVIGLLLICSVGFESLVENDFLIPRMIQEFSWASLSPVLSGAFLAFYAFIGFEDIVNLAEETKKPKVNVPWAIIIALIVSTVLYIFVAMVAISSLTPQELIESQTPIADMYVKYGGSIKVISLISLLAIVNGLLAQVIMASRIMYGLRHPFSFLSFLTKISPTTRTPINATVGVGLLVLLLTYGFSIEVLASTTSFIILIVFTFVSLSLLILEFKNRPVKTTNVIIPALAIVLNLSFIIFKLI